MVAGCVTPRGAETTSNTYGFEHFEIDVPRPSGPWGVAEYDQAKEHVVFSRLLSAPWANKQVMSFGVTRLVVPPEQASLGETEFIRQLWVSLAKDKTQDAASRGRKVTDTKDGRVVIAGRTFETFTFIATVGNWFKGERTYETHIFIWFVPDFAARGTAYRFEFTIESPWGAALNSQALMGGFIEGFRLVGTAPGAAPPAVAP